MKPLTHAILVNAAQQFADRVLAINPIGNGLINDTYLVKTDSSKFVLQRINGQVFGSPEQIMANLMKLTEHIAKKEQALVNLQVPKIITTLDNQCFYRDEQENNWRALTFIADSQCIDFIAGLEQAAQVGTALGSFHRLVSDLDPLLMYDTLPGFHVAPDYLNKYQQAAAESTRSRSPFCEQFISQQQMICHDLEQAKQTDRLGIKIIHGDPKLNNFLFDPTGNKVIAIIDLDTVKPGLIHYDIGDCVRSCCPDGVLDLSICRALLTGYLGVMRELLCEDDHAFLFAAIRLIPFELGLRFYTDHLLGNPYFKVSNPEQNKQRAIAQFQLCEQIMKAEQAIRKMLLQLKG